MAKNRLAPFLLSSNSDNESSENNIDNANMIMKPPPPKAPSSMRSRGRPKGSKNKLKTPVEIIEYPNTFMKPIFIEIPAGKDVIDSIIKMAWRHQADISVVRGVGLVSNINIHNPLSHSTPTTFQGPVQMISLSGTYINPNCDLVPSEFITDPDCCSFSIYLSGIHGQVFGGVIRGKVTASSVVLVTANLLKKPKFYRVASVNGSIPNIEKVDLMYGGVNSSQLNHQVLDCSPANMNVNQWNHYTCNSNH